MAKAKKVKIEAEIVGGVGHKVIYIVFNKNGELVKGSLYRLNHPGNMKIAEWDEMRFKKDENDSGEVSVSMDRSSKLINFFDKCVFPVNTPLTPIEKSLVDKYGANSLANNQKLDPDEIHPYEFGVWQILQERFFSGDLFFEIPELEETTIGVSSPEAGKK